MEPLPPVPEIREQGRSPPRSMRLGNTRVELDSSISWRNEPQVCRIVLPLYCCPCAPTGRPAVHRDPPAAPPPSRTSAPIRAFVECFLGCEGQVAPEDGQAVLGSVRSRQAAPDRAAHVRPQRLAG
eukprot:COSAG02_NODE_7358_length_3048_cov_2.484271_1_plen_126_part_00